MHHARLATLAFALATLVLPPSARAATTAICDANGTLATADGVIGAGEYAGASTGVGASFGGMIGAGVSMALDGSTSGQLVLGIDATGHNCTWGADDSVVIYVDSASGGFSSTAGFTDAADGGRAAASGLATGSAASSVLTFAPSFFADYAIVLRNDSASLFQLTAGGSHVFVRSLTRAPSDWTTSPCVREVSGLTMTDLGASATDGLDWVATLVNASNAFRSNELQGVASSFAPTAGALPMMLPADGMNAFAPVSPFASLSPSGPFFEHFCAFRGTGFQSSPTATQLDSDLWIENTWSDGAMTHGGSYTTGDYARGDSPGGVTIGGSYSFARGGDRGLGVQVNATELSPGYVELRLTNTGTASVTSVALAYVLTVLNDDGWSSHLDLSYSTDGTTFTTATGVGLDTGVAADPTPVWTANRRAISLPVTVAAGGSLFLRWTTRDNAGGSAGRDEFMLEDVLVTPTFAVCGNGVVEAGEQCDGGASNGSATSCCAASCAYQPALTVCGTVGSGACDLADSCDGAGTCVERVMGALVTCRSSRDLCDAEELCDGTSPQCPPDVRVAAGTTCRAASGACDVADVCSGSSDVCPDAYASVGTICAPPSLPCDLGASCTGASPTCPAHVPATAGTVCRVAVPGGCDVQEVCDGTALVCGGDVVAAAGTSCRPAVGTCDVLETCTGTSAACPADAHVADGTSCDDGVACNGVATCRTGACTPGTPPSCADGSACTTDACTEPGGACTHTPIAGCCASAADCDDADACTTDACGTGGTCSNVRLAGCCTTDVQCDDGDACTADTCAGATCHHADVCTDAGSDAGTTADAGTDAGSDVDAGLDGSVAVDAAAGDDAAMAVDAGTRSDAGDGGPSDASVRADAARDAAIVPPAPSTGSCGCRAGGADEPRLPVLVLGLALALRRVRRRRDR